MWFAVAAGVVGLLVAAGVLVSVLGLIGTGEAATAGALRVPGARIALVVILGYLSGIVLLVAVARSRSPMTAWTLVVVATIAMISASLYPLYAAATSAVDQARDVVPWVLDLVRRAVG